MENFDALKKQLNIIYAALFFGQVSFAAVVYFVLKPEYIEDPMNDTLCYVAIGLLASGAIFGRLLTNKRIPDIRAMEDETKKTQAYTGFSIIRYALIEGPVLFCIVMYLQTGAELFLYLILAGLLYFLSLTPRSSFIASELTSRNR